MLWYGQAAAPLNLYGATKLCSDKLFIAANNIRGRRDPLLCGSVWECYGVRGIWFILPNRACTGVLPITDLGMTRFNISLRDGVEMVLWAIEKFWVESCWYRKFQVRITDVAEVIGPSCSLLGIRPGEKIHEEMITASDSFSTVDLGRYYAILPSDGVTLSAYQAAGIQAPPCLEALPTTPAQILISCRWSS